MVAFIIAYKYPSAIPLRDYRVTNTGAGPVISYWSPALGAMPTQSQLDAWSAEPEFQTWLTEHGGDPVATARRIAVEMVDDPNNPICIVVRASLKVVMDEIQKVKQGNPKPSKTWDEHKAALKAALKAGLGDS